MNFCIHRGTNEIGGSCVEIWTQSTRIVIDIGMPLVNADGAQFDFGKHKTKTLAQLIADKILPNVPDLYGTAGNHVDGLLISHAHQDHYGLYDFVRADLPCYLGNASKDLIYITRLFTRKKQKTVIHTPFVSGKSFTIGDINVTPYLVDHSAFDAYAFLVEADNHRIFYSGDFRSHGRKGNTFRWFSHNAPANVDYLLLEGTNVAKPDQRQETESDIEKKASLRFKQKGKVNLIYSSGQNIDRIVSFYRAAKRANKLFVMDVYNAIVLKTLSDYARVPFPSPTFPDIRVYFPQNVTRLLDQAGKKDHFYQFRQFKITREEISQLSDRVVMLVRPGVLQYLRRIPNLVDGNFIYSMWLGYTRQQATSDFIEYFKTRGFDIHYLHTSGHADVDTLRKMVAALRPKTIIPIHTMEKLRYGSAFAVPVRELNDGEKVTV